MKIVLIGGPCTGKTTIINELEKRGYNVIHESARDVIAEEVCKDPEFKSWHDLENFQLKVLWRQIERERVIKDKEIYFLDHGIPSGIAFFESHGAEPPEELVKAAMNSKYDKVLVLERLSKYENDGQRMESEEKSAEIHSRLKAVYQKLGYELVSISDASVEERISWILEIAKNL